LLLDGVGDRNVVGQVFAILHARRITRCGIGENAGDQRHVRITNAGRPLCEESIPRPLGAK
jgi:hypothetical protein